MGTWIEVSNTIKTVRQEEGEQPRAPTGTDLQSVGTDCSLLIFVNRQHRLTHDCVFFLILLDPRYFCSPQLSWHRSAPSLYTVLWLSNSQDLTEGWKTDTRVPLQRRNTQKDAHSFNMQSYRAAEQVIENKKEEQPHRHECLILYLDDVMNGNRFYITIHASRVQLSADWTFHLYSGAD